MYRDVSKDRRFLEVQRLLRELEKDYKLPKQVIVDFSDIPVSVFVPELGPLEAIVKYLRENKGLSITAVARVLDRSKQGIWQAYEKAKGHDKLEAESRYNIPVSVLAGKFPVLEAVVKHLKESYQLTFADIAKLLSRDQRTVWTVYRRSKKR